MARALQLAETAAQAGEVPVGAIITCPPLESKSQPLVARSAEQIIAQAENRVERDQDGTAHAELLALRQAATVLGRHLESATLWVTLEPCAMCAEAASHARLGRLVFAAGDPRWGAVEHGARLYDQPWSRWRPEVIAGVKEEEAKALLQNFFAAKRTGKAVSS